VFLHITNGESVVCGFEDAGLEGDYLSWIDLLYEGPVPTADLDELAPIRARFHTGAAGRSYEAVLADFRARDDSLKAFRRHVEVVLWFEHDLTDQLQLIQLLGWFAHEDLDTVRLSLINVDAHPAVRPFYGLGQLSGRQLADMLPARKPVSAGQLSLGHRAWTAFCAREPLAWCELLTTDLSALPFLENAVRRHLQEYPSVQNGLSRTDAQILRAAAAGSVTRRQIFQASQDAEPAPFMGDSSVYDRIDRLAAGPAPALDKIPMDTFSINQHGRALLANTADLVGSVGGIDSWLGGVHLAGAHAAWRWDEHAQALIPA
jgi:hypothetical protein